MSARASPRLHAFEGGGVFEPGSRLMWIGLDRHDPLEAMRHLVESPPTMSVALHEVMHAQSLRNSLGHVLSFLGQLASTSAQNIRYAADRGTPVLEADVDLYLYFRAGYARLLEAWTPLLEGLAVYAQTCEPCQGIDEIVPPLDTLGLVAVTLTSLDPPHFPTPGPPLDQVFLDSMMRGVLSSGYRAMSEGALLPSGKDAFAAVLEFDVTPHWLPYFLGHVYVRALQDRLRRADEAFACPEVFLHWLLDALAAATRRLLGPDASWESASAIGSVYGWIELIEGAPAERLRELRRLDWDVDALLYLETGERRVGQKRGSEEPVSTLAALAAGPWRIFVEMLSRTPFWRERGVGADITGEEVARRVVIGLLVGSETLNVSSGGSAQAVGWLPAAFTSRDGVALRVGGATWWLAVREEERARLPFELDRVQRLPAETRPGDAIDAAAPGEQVRIDSYVTFSPYDAGTAEGGEGGPTQPRCLFELSADDDRAILLLAVQGPDGLQRAVLEPAPAATTTVLHDATLQLRANISGAFGVGLEQLAGHLDRLGSTQLAERVRGVERAEELARSRQRELWARRILRGVLGPHVSAATQRAIISQGMAALLADTPSIRTIVARSYAGPRPLDGELDAVREANDGAAAVLGRPVFRMGAEGQTAQYVGLWGGDVG
jgi:hypothetical protein